MIKFETKETIFELPTEDLKKYFKNDKVLVKDLKISEFHKKIKENKSYFYLINSVDHIFREGIKALIYNSDEDMFYDLYIKDDFYFPSDVIFIDDNKYLFSCRESRSYKDFLECR